MTNYARVPLNDEIVRYLTARKIFFSFNDAKPIYPAEIILDTTAKVGSSIGVYNGNWLPVCGSFSFTHSSLKFNGIKFGNYCSIGEGVDVFGAEHPTRSLTTSPIGYGSSRQLFSPSPTQLICYRDVKKSNSVLIGSDVWVGRNALIKNGVQISNGAVIGAGSVVTRDVKPFEVVAGNPAAHIRFRFPREICDLLQSIKWWDYDKAVLMNVDLNEPIEAIVRKIEFNILNEDIQPIVLSSPFNKIKDLLLNS